MRLTVLFSVVAAAAAHRCPCAEPLKVGPCEALIPRWYFSTEEGTCLSFQWGGCQPNGNNFETLADCSERCMDESCGRPRFCLLPPDVGPCEAAIPSYYFDGESCREFTYGGCEGNANRFDTVAQCEAACRPDTGACSGKTGCPARY